MTTPRPASTASFDAAPLTEPVDPKAVTENTMRRGFTPELES